MVRITRGTRGAVGVAICVAVMLLPAGADAARKRPELKVTSLEGLGATARPGSELEVRDTVANKGKRRAKRTRNSYFLSVNRVREAGDVKLEGSRKVPRLGARKSSTKTVELGVPGGTARGDYLLIACADAGRRVREKRESNNCTASADRIEVTTGGPGDHEPPPRPRITATDPVSPANDNSPRVFGEAEAGARVRIYSGDCSGPSLESGSAAAFNGVGGITVVGVRGDATTDLRATATDEAGNVSDCSAAFAYTEDSTAPGTPAIASTSPTSPADDASPEVVGSLTGGAGALVSIYATSCTGTPLATASTATFAAGVTVPVPDDATTALVANAVDPAGNVSGCSDAFAYTEDSTAPAAPAITATNPPSSEVAPASEPNITVIGAAEAGSLVVVYQGAGCAALVTTGSAATFAASGITVTGIAATTDFSARAIDPAGNVSACSAPPFTYYYAAAPPPPPP